MKRTLATGLYGKPSRRLYSIASCKLASFSVQWQVTITGGFSRRWITRWGPSMTGRLSTEADSNVHSDQALPLILHWRAQNTLLENK